MHHWKVPVALLLFTLFASPLPAADNRPNIVMIVADDLGVECVQSYGGLSYQTPQIDALAADGMRFTNCFSNPYCSPSRAQLLTGRYPFRNGITRVIYDPKRHREFLDPAEETSFARLLQRSGYATAIAGKWQVSFLHERDTVQQHGFEEYQLWQIFHNGQKTSRYANPTMRQNGKVLHEELQGQYGPDANLAFLIDFMKRHREGPFLLYYTAMLPHWPWEPTPDSQQPLRAAKGNGNPKYMPDMVAYLDKQVGQLVNEIDKLGLRDNTIVIFTGDNGTDRRITSKWTNGTTTRNVKGGKGTLTDAGTHVPLIASWPDTIEPASISQELVDLSDFLPTMVELADAETGDQTIDGRSFVPLLSGRPTEPRQWVHVQDHGNRYVRNHEFILSNKGVLRPVVETGQRPAKPVTGSLNEQQRAAKEQLQQALHGLQ